MFLAIGCSSVATGNGEEGVHRRVGGEGGGKEVLNTGGGQQRVCWGGLRAIVGGGSTVGVSSTSKNRPSRTKYKSTKQFETELNSSKSI